MEKLPGIEPTEIIRHIDGTPPIEWLEDCDTPNRREHWEQIRGMYECIGVALKALFEGDTAALDGLTPEGQEWAKLHRDDYLALYRVLFEGWKDISKQWADDGIDNLPDNPKKLFFTIIEVEAGFLMIQAFPSLNRWNPNPYQPFSPQKQYRFRNEGLKLAAKGQNLTKAEKRKAQKHQAELLRLNKKNWGIAMRNYCLMAIADSKPRKGGALHRALMEYKRVDAELWDCVYKASHPRKAPTGWHWTKDGRRLETGAKGRLNSS